MLKAGNDFSEETLRKHSLQLSIQYFKPLDGISAEAVELFNIRLIDFKREADIQITN